MKIEQENTEIKVGIGGKLVVPREDLRAEFDDEGVLDMSLAIVKFKKPDRREWVYIYGDKEFQAKMLVHKKSPDAMDTEHYYVDPALRLALVDELKTIRIIPYYSIQGKSIGLWPLTVNVGMTWYDSAAIVLKQPTEFLKENVIRLISDKPNSRYQIRFKPIPDDAKIPDLDRDIGELLGEALGEQRFITSSQHPIYRDLTVGLTL